jgi:hypothetical protein
VFAREEYDRALLYLEQQKYIQKDAKNPKVLLYVPG